MNEREFWLDFYRHVIRSLIDDILKLMIRSAIMKLLREEVREDDWNYFTECQERTRLAPQRRFSAGGLVP